MSNPEVKSSLDVAHSISQIDFTVNRATVVGYGNMGHHYVQALISLGVNKIRVFSRSAAPLQELQNSLNISTMSGGYERIEGPVSENDIAIVATPTSDLIPATLHLVERGFRKILIEKHWIIGWFF